MLYRDVPSMSELSRSSPTAARRTERTEQGAFDEEGDVSFKVWEARWRADCAEMRRTARTRAGKRSRSFIFDTFYDSAVVHVR